MSRRRRLMRSRRVQGCYYFGCFMPICFAALLVLGLIERIRQPIRRRRQAQNAKNRR